MPRLMVDLSDEMVERVRRSQVELRLPGRPSVSKALAHLIEHGVRAIEEERRDAERTAVYAAWADDANAHVDAERNVTWMRTEGRL